MKVIKISSSAQGIMRAELLRPFKTALRTVNALEELTVRVVDDTGCVGWGSVVPTPAITGDTEARIRQDVSSLLQEIFQLQEVDVWHWQAKISAAKNACSSALCAVDIALHDLAAQRAGQPLWRWLEGQTARTLKTNMTLSVDEPPMMAQCGADAVQAGFDSLKIKVGGDAELDQQRVRAIRDRVGPSVTLRLDANQGWSKKDALHLIPWFCENCGPIEFIEQPVKAHDLKALAAITGVSPVPIVADESAMTFSQAREVLDVSAANALSVKLIKAGGITEALRILDLAAERGVPCLMSCMFEVGAGLQAAAHLATMHPAVRWVDLDPVGFLRCMPYPGGAIFSGSEIHLGASPGLGIDLSDSLV